MVMANQAPNIPRLASYLLLYGAKSTDPVERFSGDRRSMGHMDVVELASRVRPTRYFVDPSTLVQMPQATVRVCLQIKQRLTRVLIQEVVIDLDEHKDEVAMAIHWTRGRQTEIHLARTRTGRYPDDRHPSPVEVIRTLGGHWPDRQLPTTMNRMRCKRNNGESWTTLRVRELRERFGVPAFNPAAAGPETISVDETARRLKICVGSVLRLIKADILPAQQLMPCAPWQVPVDALESQQVKTGVQDVIARRPLKVLQYHQNKTLKLPGF